jgi:hypothetical protein
MTISQAIDLIDYPTMLIALTYVALSVCELRNASNDYWACIELKIGNGRFKLAIGSVMGRILTMLIAILDCLLAFTVCLLVNDYSVPAFVLRLILYTVLVLNIGRTLVATRARRAALGIGIHKEV